MANSTALGTQVQQHLSSLWRFALVLSRNRDTADDLVQSTCLRALEKSHLYEPNTRLDRWLFSIMINIWRNELRAAKIRQGRGFVEAEKELVFDGISAIETNIMATKVLTEVMALPDAQREAVLLVYLEGMRYREAAKILDVPIGTIMSRLASARQKLARLNAVGIEVIQSKKHN